MGFFDAISDFVSNTVNSVADVMSDVGKATGLTDIAKSLNLAGEGSNALEVAAILTGGYYAYGAYGASAAAAGDAAAYEAATATTAAGMEVPAGSIIDGVVTQGGMTVPWSNIASGSTLANGTQVVSTVGASGLDSILASSATAGWASTTMEALKTASQAVNLMRIVNASGEQKLVPKNSPVPSGWAIDPTFSPTASTTGATLGNVPFIQQSTADTVPSGLIFVAIGAAVLYFVGNKK